MFNLQGSEIVIILLLALVVLGPEKLPGAMRKAGQFYGELKRMSTGFQAEFRAAVEEPLRELKDTANTIRDSADFTKLQSGERSEKPKSAEMLAAADPDAVPTVDLPFAEDAATAQAETAGSGDPFEDPNLRVSTLADVEATGADHEHAEISPSPAAPQPFSSSRQLSSSPLPAAVDAGDVPEDVALDRAGDAGQAENESAGSDPADQPAIGDEDSDDAPVEHPG